MVSTQIENDRVNEHFANSSITVPSGEVWEVQILSFNDDGNRAGVYINNRQVAHIYDNLNTIPMSVLFSTVLVGGDTVRSEISTQPITIQGYKVESNNQNSISNSPISIQLSNSQATVPTGERWNVNVQIGTETQSRDYLLINGSRVQELYDNVTGIPQQSNFDFSLNEGDVIRADNSIDAHIGGYKI